MKSSKKLFAILTLVAFMMTLVPMAAFAAVSAVTATPSVNATGATAVYTVNFTTAAALPNNGTVTVVFPAGTNLAGVGNADITSSTIDGTFTAGVVGTTLTITRAADGTAEAAGAQVVTIADVVNGTANAAATLTVETSTDAGAVASAAFAIRAVNRFAASATVDTTSVTANATDDITMTVWALDATNQPVSGAAILAASSRGGTEVITTSPATTDALGKATFSFVSSVAGSAKIAAGIPAVGADLLKYLQGDPDTSAEEAGLIDAFDVTFGAASASTVTCAIPAGAVSANGIDTKEVTAVVRDTNGNPIANQAIEFSVDKAGASLSVYSGTTDAVGQVKTKVSTTKSGVITVTATAGSKSGNVAVTFGVGGGYDVVLDAGNNQKVARTTAPSAITFKVTDINGNKVANPVDGVNLTNPTSATFVSKPSGTSLTDANLTLINDANGLAEIVWTANPDKNGTYVVRVALPNGKAATATLEVADQGTISATTISYKQSSLGHGLTTNVPTIKLVDAAGIGVNEPATNYTWSSSNTNLATVNAATGAVTATAVTDRKGTVVITAVHNTKKLVATAEIRIGSVATSLVGTGASGEVGVNAAVTAQLVDADGVAVAYSQTNQAAVTLTTTVVSKPDGAIVEVSTPSITDYQKALVQSGKVTINVKSSKAGKVKLAIYTNETGAAANHMAIVEVDVVAAKVVVGAKAVTMFIGAKGFVQDGTAKVGDVAPFIKDSRTFVAVRPIADAFGAEIAWNEATQTVTLTRSDMTVTIVIGGAVTKTVGGVSTAVASDVPAFITAEGRTVLPFRAVGDAFGATVSYDAATQAVSFAQ